MGYTITIGELKISKDPEDGLECSCISFDAELVRRGDAPAFGEPTDYTNSRWPSYGVWQNALRRFNLEPVFFDNGHLIGGHPGARLVTQEMVDVVRCELARWRLVNPDVAPEFNNNEEAADLARVIWLDYWLTWALKNCETPVVANS